MTDDCISIENDGEIVRDVKVLVELFKIATVRPIFKKGGRTEIKNYRPVSLLNIFTKIYERILHENLTNNADTFLSKFNSAYR